MDFRIGISALQRRKELKMLGAVLAICVLQAAASKPAQAPPEALTRLFQTRHALKTGRVECTEEMHGKLVGGKPLRLHTTHRLGEETSIWTNRGDDNGAVYRDYETGAPLPSAPQTPFHHLSRDGQVWEHQELSIEAELGPRGSGGAWDVRTLGVLYGNSLRDLASTLWKDNLNQPAARKYSETVRDGLHIVRAQSDVGTIEWTIDPNKDWEATHVALYQNGELFSEARIALAQFDGVWFPQAVQYFVKGFEGGRKPQSTVTVHAAEFNRPEQPLEFMPEDIGIVKDVTAVKLRTRNGDLVAHGMYNGATFVTPDQRAAERAAERAATSATGAGQAPAGPIPAAPDGDVPPTIPNLRAALARPPRTFETEWEAYTRKFIEEFRLDENQSQKAWAICRQCQERASSHIVRHQTQFDGIQKLLDQADAGKLPDPQRAFLQASAERKRVFEPIDRIFETELKPRLEKLPTRAQRVATQPTAPAAGRGG